MIPLERIRDPVRLKAFSGPALHKRLAKLLSYYYEHPQGVDFKPKARQTWGSAKAMLKEESNGKCAYCEADTSVVAHGDVEHFRPKSSYWWLAYCYDNYTYSCQICNQSYKADRFTRQGAALPAPSVPTVPPSDAPALAALVASLCPDPCTSDRSSLRRYFGREDADLPHPYLDDTERLFAWKVVPVAKEVHLVSRGRSARALRATQAAQTLLGLNRAELLRVRWTHYDELEALALVLQEVTLPSGIQTRLLQKIREFGEPRRPFAAMTRFFLREWGLMA